MGTPRIIAHPVMGWYVIALLAIIVAVPPVYLLVGHNAAWVLSVGGTIAVQMWGGIMVLRDRRRRRYT